MMKTQDSSLISNPTVDRHISRRLVWRSWRLWAAASPSLLMLTWSSWLQRRSSSPGLTWRPCSTTPSWRQSTTAWVPAHRMQVCCTQNRSHCRAHFVETGLPLAIKAGRQWTVGWSIFKLFIKQPVFSVPEGLLNEYCMHLGVCELLYLLFHYQFTT